MQGVTSIKEQEKKQETQQISKKYPLNQSHSIESTAFKKKEKNLEEDKYNIKNNKQRLSISHYGKRKFLGQTDLSIGKEGRIHLTSFLGLFVPAFAFILYQIQYIHGLRQKFSYEIDLWLIFVISNSIICFILFACCSLKNPGFIAIPLKQQERKQLQQVQIKNKQEFFLKYCITCKIFRPLRTHHCRICDLCIEERDHHCPFLNNCIGRLNRRSYLYFLITSVLLELLVIAESLCQLIQPFTQSKPATFLSQLQKVSFILAIIQGLYASLLGTNLSSLLLFQIKLIINNRTTDELRRILDPKINKIDVEFNKSFDKGCARNFFEVFCGCFCFQPEVESIYNQFETLSYEFREKRYLYYEQKKQLQLEVIQEKLKPSIVLNPSEQVQSHQYDFSMPLESPHQLLKYPNFYAEAQQIFIPSQRSSFSKRNSSKTLSKFNFLSQKNSIINHQSENINQDQEQNQNLSSNQDSSSSSSQGEYQIQKQNYSKQGIIISPSRQQIQSKQMKDHEELLHRSLSSPIYLNQQISSKNSHNNALNGLLINAQVNISQFGKKNKGNQRNLTRNSEEDREENVELYDINQNQYFNNDHTTSFQTRSQLKAEQQRKEYLRNHEISVLGKQDEGRSSIKQDEKYSEEQQQEYFCKQDNNNLVTFKSQNSTIRFNQRRVENRTSKSKDDLSLSSSQTLQIKSPHLNQIRVPKNNTGISTKLVNRNQIIKMTCQQGNFLQEQSTSDAQTPTNFAFSKRSSSYSNIYSHNSQVISNEKLILRSEVQPNLISQKETIDKQQVIENF